MRGGGGPGRVEAEAGVIQFKLRNAKRCWSPPDAGKGQEGSSPGPPQSMARLIP